MDYLLVMITRIIVVISIINTFFCIFYRVMNKIKKKKMIVFTLFLFSVLVFVSFLYNIVPIMSDFVKNTVLNSDTQHILFYFVYNGIINLLINMFMFYITTKYVEFCNDSIIIHKLLFIKKYIYFHEIDTKNSVYVFDNRKSIFKKSVLLNHDQYVLIAIKNTNLKIKIGLNDFLYSNVNIDSFAFFVFDLKISRKEIK